MVERGEVETFDFEGRRYICSMDVEDDGLYLRLDLIDGSSTQTLIDVFHSDETKKMMLTACSEDVSLPLEVVEWFIREARRRLTAASTPTLAAEQTASN